MICFKVRILGMLLYVVWFFIDWGDYFTGLLKCYGESIGVGFWRMSRFFVGGG